MGSAAESDGNRLARELLEAQQESEAARHARSTAESARDRAERARDVAESRGDEARDKLGSLLEEVDFLQEQVVSARRYLEDVVDQHLADLHVERAALMLDIAALHQELKRSD